MLAIKANRQYTITEADVEAFVKEGYDIYDESGELVRHGAGKTVTFEKYAQLLGSYEKLMAENAKLVSENAELAEKLAKKTRRTKKADEPKEEE